MNFGQLCVLIALIVSFGSAIVYYLDERNRGRLRQPSLTPTKQGMLAKRLYYVSTGCTLLASAVLFYLFQTHQYQYSYVAEFSSNSQPMIYLISAFWAGQEGTFLFWALMTSLMGVVFLRTSKEPDGYALVVINLFLAFLNMLMMVKSPFNITAIVPPDGSGLNPLLQDPWMAIHPPILFVGYAATVFPFALVVSGLARKNYTHWFQTGFAWTIFAALMLGAGIIIGGFWAYEVLGWGGYWGWDPVENSSLVPWIVLLVLIHGLVIQKAKGSFVRTNIFFALLTFILVLYATFLTRSGILADFSVHSFVDLGINNYLVGSMVLSVVAGFGLFVTRFSQIKSPKVEFYGLNRETTLLLSMYVLCAAALFTFAGMSSPILTGLIGKASQVDTSFYNKVNLPVAIAMSLLLGITPFLGWSSEEKSAIFKRLSMSLLLTALSCVIAYVAGVTTTMLLLFVGSSAFGLISNVIIAFRQYRSGWVMLGGPISHIGVGLLLIGILGSGNYDESKTIVLKQGEPQSAHGYTFTFKDISETPNLRTQVNIEVADGKNIYKADPKLYYSEYNQSMLREPDIKIFPLKDIYISPLELKEAEHKHDHPTAEIAKGQTVQVGPYAIEFVQFQTGVHGQSGGMSVGALLKVTVDGVVHEVMPLVNMNEKGERESAPVDLPALKDAAPNAHPQQIMLAGMNVEQKKILLQLSGDEHHEEGGSYELLVDISTKPLMMVVWTGVVLIIAGSAIAFKRRLKSND